MEMKKIISTKLLALVVCFAIIGTVAVAEDSLAVKCSKVLDKVTQCLPFATNKATTPSKDCCDSVTDLKETDPACLCFIIQQIHNGSNAAVKSMGIQESRLLQLPSACKLANASITQCPSLLHLAPNSPDAAIFTNSSSTATTTTPVANPGTSSPTTASNGFWEKPQLVITGYLTVAVMIFFHGLPC